MTTEKTMKNVGADNTCVVCELKSLTDKQYVEHCWSLMHHLKCEQQLKGTKHTCNLCKMSCKSVKEYGQHLSDPLHSSARDKFYRSLDKGKTVEQLIKTKIILKPEITIPAKPLEFKGGSSKKQEAKDVRQAGGQQRSEECYPSNLNYTDFSWQFGQCDPNFYQGYNYFGEPGQYSNYNGSNLYQNAQWNENAGNFTNAWNVSYDGNWQASNYHPNNFRGRNFRNNMPHKMYENRANFDCWPPADSHMKQHSKGIAKFKGSKQGAARSKSVERSEKAAYNKTDRTSKQTSHKYWSAGDNSTRPKSGEKHHNEEESRSKDEHISADITSNKHRPASDYSTRLKSDAKPRHREEESTSKVDHRSGVVSSSRDDCRLTIESEERAKVSVENDVVFKTAANDKAPEPIADNSAVPPNSAKQCSTPGRKAKSPSKGNSDTVDGLSPPKTPQLQSGISANDLSKDAVSRLVNLSCSRKEKLLLQKLMQEHGRAQSLSDSRLGQNLLALVKEAMAADVVKALSSAGPPDSPSADSLQKVKLSVLPADIFGQLVEFLNLTSADLSNSDADCEITNPDVAADDRKAIGETKEPLVFHEDVKVVEMKPTSLIGNVMPDVFSVPDGLLDDSELQRMHRGQLQPDNNANLVFENYKDVNKKKKKKNGAGTQAKQKKLKKAKSSDNIVGNLVETLQLLSSKLEAGISKLDGKAVDHSNPTKTGKDLVKSPKSRSSKTMQEIKGTKTKKKKKLKVTSSARPFKGITAIDRRNDRKSSDERLNIDNDRSLDGQANEFQFRSEIFPSSAVDHSATSLKIADLNSCRVAGEQSTNFGAQNTNGEFEAQNCFLKLENADPDFENQFEPGNATEMPSPFDQNTVKIKTEVLDAEIEEAAELLEIQETTDDDCVLKPQVVEEIIIEGERILELNEGSLTVHLEPRTVTKAVPAQHLMNASCDDVLRSTSSPTLSSLGASTFAIQALDYAIEEEGIESQIQVLQKQVMKLQQVESKLQERKQFIQQERAKIMRRLKATIEGRKQAASVNKIISEIPVDPFKLGVFSPTSEQTRDQSFDSAVERVSCDGVGRNDPPITTSNLNDNSFNESLVDTPPRRSSSSSSCVSKNLPPTNQVVKRKMSKSNENLEESLPKKNDKKRKVGKVKDGHADVFEKQQTKTAQQFKLDEKKSKSTLGISAPLPRSLTTVETKTVSNFFGHVDTVMQLTAHGGKLYSCSTDGTVRRFKTKSNNSEQKCLSTFTHQSDKVVAMEVIIAAGNDVEDCIITASSDGILKQFDLRSGGCVGLINCNEEVTCIIFQWSCLFVGFSDGLAARCILKKFRILDKYICSNFPITCMATTVEGAYRLLCTGSTDKSVSVREAHSGLLIRCYALERDHPTKISVINGVSYTLGSNKKQCRSVYVHHFLTGELLNEVKYASTISSMHISDEQMLLLLGGNDGLIRVVDLKTRKQKQLYYGAGFKTVTSLCLHKKLLISANADGQIEACKITPNQTYVCKYGKCPAKFAYYEDVARHVEHIHANSKPVECLAANCGHLFGNSEDVRDISLHILTHVQQVTQDQ